MGEADQLRRHDVKVCQVCTHIRPISRLSFELLFVTNPETKNTGSIPRARRFRLQMCVRHQEQVRESSPEVCPINISLVLTSGEINILNAVIPNVVCRQFNSVPGILDKISSQLLFETHQNCPWANTFGCYTRIVGSDQNDLVCISPTLPACLYL